MDPASEFIDRFLQHARDYDPVAAREYYLRTRELKGRRSASGLNVNAGVKGRSKAQREKDKAASDAKKEQWGYVKEQVKTERQGELDKARDSKTAQIKALRDKASVQREKVREIFKGVMEELTNKRKDELAKIQEDVDAKIAAVPPVPKGVSKERRAELSAERSEKIAKIRGEAKDKQADVSEDTQKKRDVERAENTSNREGVAEQLKAGIDKARENYTKLKEEIKAKYEAEYQKEYDTIKNS